MMAKQKLTFAAVLAMATLAGAASAQTGRNYLTIAGSYTVYLLGAGLIRIPLPEYQQAQADAKELKLLGLKSELARTFF